MKATTARRIAAGALLLAVLLLGGCGPQVKFTPVSGTVKINGRPAANISVQFMPDALKGGKGPTSFGTTDKDGKFELKTYEGQEGAAVGPHRAVLTDMDEDRPPQGVESRRGSRLAPQFSDPTTALSVEVKEGVGPINLDGRGP